MMITRTAAGKRATIPWSTPLLTLKPAPHTPCRKSGNTCSTCWTAATRRSLQRRGDSVTQRNGRMSSTQQGSRALLQIMPFERSSAQRRNSAHGSRQGHDVVCSGRAVVQCRDAGNWPHRPRGSAVMERTIALRLTSGRGCILHLASRSKATNLSLHSCLLWDHPAGPVSGWPWQQPELMKLSLKGSQCELTCMTGESQML